MSIDPETMNQLERLSGIFPSNHNYVHTLDREYPGEEDEGDFIINGEHEDTGKYALCTIADDDYWRSDFAKLVFLLIDNHDNLIAEAKRATLFERKLTVAVEALEKALSVFDAMLLAMGPFSESERSIINYALDLREAVRVLGNEVVDYRFYDDQSNDGFTDEEWAAFVNRKRGHRIEVNANPIASAAVEAARKGGEQQTLSR